MRKDDSDNINPVRNVLLVHTEHLDGPGSSYSDELALHHVRIAPKVGVQRCVPESYEQVKKW